MANRRTRRAFVPKKVALEFCRGWRTEPFMVRFGLDETMERDRKSFVEVTLTMEYDELNGKTRGVPFKPMKSGARRKIGVDKTSDTG